MQNEKASERRISNRFIDGRIHLRDESLGNCPHFLTSQGLELKLIRNQFKETNINLALRINELTDQHSIIQ